MPIQSRTFIENEITELKTSFSDEVIISLVAFANTKGGKVYIGISDKGEIKGIDIGKETIQQWLNEIKLKTQPSIIPTIEELAIEGRTVIAIQVQ